jgi:hypothetical protein
VETVFDVQQEPAMNQLDLQEEMPSSRWCSRIGLAIAQRLAASGRG